MTLYKNVEGLRIWQQLIEELFNELISCYNQHCIDIDGALEGQLIKHGHMSSLTINNSWSRKIFAKLLYIYTYRGLCRSV